MTIPLLVRPKDSPEKPDGDENQAGKSGEHRHQQREGTEQRHGAESTPTPLVALIMLQSAA